MKSISRDSPFFIPLLLGCLVLFLALRLRWFGHLLMWDEAMNLCSARAFAAGGQDAYSPWFWRAPPLFNSMILLANPLHAGFLFRAQWLPLIIGVCNMIMLAVLNRRIIGPGLALWSCLAYAVMPGAIFFDLWIKQDCMVAFTGLFAIYLCTKQKWPWAGLMLGLCFLSKEMALFYAVAIAVLLVKQRQYRALATVTTIAAIAACWWYFAFSSTIRLHFQETAGTLKTASMTLWDRPWYYYFTAALGDLGPLGVALALAGLGASARARDYRFWPVALAVPTLLIITIARAKAPWYIITIYPAVATLQGIGAFSLWAWLRARFPDTLPGRIVPAIATAAVAVLLVLPVLGRTYEDAMRNREEGMWWAASMSREAADTLNGLVRNGEKAMITPMCYYQGTVSFPCPIFVIYLKDMAVLVRPNNMTVQEFASSVRGYELDWAMVSPTPGRPTEELLGSIEREYGLKPLRLRGATIFHTASMHAKQP